LTSVQVWVLHGDDEIAIRHAVDGLLAPLNASGMLDLNLTRLDGRQASEDELRGATGAIPFLSEFRMVVLSHPLARLADKKARERFLALLDGLPPTTRLVMTLDDQLKLKKKDSQFVWEWETLQDKHWLSEWVRRDPKARKMEGYSLPKPEEMPGWIVKKARDFGGEFSPDAAQMLAGHTGSDTRWAELEIDKLLTYVDRSRAVSVEDVETLTAPGTQATVFQLVDALAEGSARKAQRILHQLLAEEDAMALFGMIIRQYRLLILARELLDDGISQPDEAARRCGEPPFVMKKAFPQARRYSLGQLKSIYHRLLEMDLASKGRGDKLPLEASLDLLVTEMERG